MKTELHSLGESISRRQLVLLGLSLGVPTFLLEGCGGSHHHSGGESGGSGNETVSTSVTVVLPTGLAATGLMLVAGRSEAALGHGKPNATVIKGSPTLVSVVDTASSRVVMLGTVDPRDATHTLDAKNVAATLLYLSLGSTQLLAADRNALWTTIVAATATADLATVVTTRLNADPYALENGDSQIVAALATAVAAVGTRSARGTPVAKPRASRAATVLPAPAVPAIGTDIGTGSGFPNGNQPIKGRIGDDIVLPDAFSLLINATYETALFVYGVSPTVGQAQSVSRISGPLAIPGLASPGVLYADNFPLALQNAGDAFESIRIVSLSPRFDAADGDPFGDAIYASEVATWRATLAAMRERAVVGLAAGFLLEALGVGGVTPPTGSLPTVTTSFLGLGGNATTDLQTAATGRNLDETVDGLLEYSTANATQAQAVVTALRPLAPDLLPTASASRLVQQMGTLRIAKLLDVEGFSQTYGRVAQGLQNTVSRDDPLSAQLSNTLKKVVLTLTPDATTYTPGGANVKITLTDNTAEYLPYKETFITHWKLFGAGDASLDDGKGNVGREFDSNVTSVTLATKSSASGLQTIGVELFRPTAAGRVSLVKATLGVQPATGGGPFTLSPSALQTSPGGTLGLEVDVSSFPSGVDPSHVRYQWKLEDTGIGQFKDPNGNGAAVQTTANSISFVASADAFVGNQGGVSVTVAQIDPSTGAFTNLAVLTGTITLVVGTGCELIVEGPSFPLSDLANPNTHHYLENTQLNIGNDAQGPYYSSVYQPHGTTGGDYVYVTLHPGANVAEGTALDFGDGGNATVSVLLGKANGGLAYSFDTTSGSGKVVSVTKNASGTVTYVHFIATIACSDSVSKRSFTAEIEGGI